MGTNKRTLSLWILRGCAVLGIAAMVMPGSARAGDALTLEDGVALHEQIDAYNSLKEAE